jgi:hypothetical protein
MSDSTYRTTGGLPPNVQITFRDEAIQPGLRQAAERSVATLVARFAEEVRQARAAESELAKLTDAVNAPFAKLIEGDSQAVKALDELRSHRLIDPHDTDALGPDAFAPRGYGQWVPPYYHFSWFWHDPNGHPPFNRIIDPSFGRIGLDARSGAVDGGADGFVSAHAGFGVSLRTIGEPDTAYTFGSGGGQFSYAMKTVGIGSGSNATSEGGVEATAFEDGHLIASSSSKMWRRRISAIEEAHGGGPLQHWQSPPGVDSLRFTMYEGRQYTFNVGAWVFSDRSTGAGVFAAVQSLIDAYVENMYFRWATD